MTVDGEPIRAVLVTGCLCAWGDQNVEPVVLMSTGSFLLLLHFAIFCSLTIVFHILKRTRVLC